MRLATFNLYQYLSPPYFWYENDPYNCYSEEGWVRKNIWIREQLKTLNADVIGFQEVFSGNELRTLAAEAGYPHFILSDGPEQIHPEDDQIRIHPRLALASRYPILEQHSIDIPVEAIEAMNLNPDFQFSRTPISVTIEDPEFSEIRVTVVHLKSKRPFLEMVAYAEETWEERALDTMIRTSQGNIASLLQRGAEAAMLYHNYANFAYLNTDTPYILMGDLNDLDQSTIFEALTMKGQIYDIGEDNSKTWPDWMKSYLHSLRLTDSFRLSLEHENQARPHTHIYRDHQNTLDYILLSNHFHYKNDDATFKVTDFNVLNEHLNNDGVGDKHQSDHGQVVVEVHLKDHVDIIPITDPTPILGDVITRQDFLNLAGGVYQSRRQYSDWSGNDKYDAFWSFFFNEDFGWVKSAYGDIPISELYQKQRYSIEHIIPKSFLKNYLGSKGKPNSIRYGATANPLNFVAAERNLNSSRSSFPFDMDGDKVVRPFRITLNPDAYGSTGFDHETEWVIPSGSRGEIARAILYMVLTYEIDELYNRHLDTLVHWAKVDPATPWEVAYNAWVQSKLGIRNPFIDTPEKALRLLENETLMRSVVLLPDIEN